MIDFLFGNLIEEWSGHWIGFFSLLFMGIVAIEVFTRIFAEESKVDGMKIERIKRYQRDPLFRQGWWHYQEKCRFYAIDFEIRDQCMNVCDHYVEQLYLMSLTDDEMLSIFIQAQLVLTKRLDKREIEINQIALNEDRMCAWILKKIRIRYAREGGSDGDKKHIPQKIDIDQEA